MKLLNRYVLGLFTFVLSFGVFGADIRVSEQYIRETIPGTQISSAYMTLSNQLDKEMVLIAVSSNISERIELHEHLMADGMMKMQQVDSIVIEANQQTVLQPHGYHIMIFNLHKPLKANSVVDMTLEFSNGNKQNITVPVKGIKQLGHHH